jgi:hypothetical protein
VVTTAIPVRPILRAELGTAVDGRIELRAGTGTFDIEPTGDVSRETLVQVLQRLDGTLDTVELARLLDLDDARLASILGPAVAMGLVDDVSPPQATSGLAVLSALEDTLNGLMDVMVFRGPFWKAVTESPHELDHNVFYGFGLENWFFLNSETRFDAPVVSHPTSAGLRALLQQFFHEEHGHDDLVAQAFVPLGISRSHLLRARPLPTTTALINLLTWWSRTDPLFFLATVGVLEGRLDSGDPGEGAPAHDSFLYACEQVGVRSDFVGPLRAHAEVNASHDHGSMSRRLFAEVPGVAATDEQRWHDKAHLFVETYAQFFNGVLDHYARPGRPLLRLLTADGS